MPTPDLLILDTGVGAAAWNMAVDEILLLRAHELHCPILRFYAWREPAATFGYSQRISEVRMKTALRPLIRRCTGGGIVPHDRDWTYSLTVPSSHPWYSLRATESYRAMHLWVAESLTSQGLATSLAPCCDKPAPGQCFLGHEVSDVLIGGRKIAGAAQRRTKIGLLIQGSIQPPENPPLERSTWQVQMSEKASRIQFSTILPTALPGHWAEAAEQLAIAKYERQDYNESR